MRKTNFETRSKIVKPEDVETNPVDLLPHEIVLSFDHILDQIFGLLDTPDLFSCRLVSLRFLKFAQRPLEKRICKSFTNRASRCRTVEDASGRPLTQLTEFLEQSAAAAESDHNQILFPCTHFWLYGPQLGNDVVQNLLNIYGPRIQKLKIFRDNFDITPENLLMDQLSHLLTIQAPHIESFTFLSVFPRVEWEQDVPIQGSTNRDSYSRSNYSALRKSDPEFQQISSRVESLPRKSSLKILNIFGFGLAKTMECLFQLSPKLQEVATDNQWNYRHLLQPVNRVHLLKCLVFQPHLKAEKAIYRIFDLKTIEKLSLENNLRLRELEINFQKALPVCETKVELENKVVLILNRILEGSKDSLEQLRLRSVSFLRGMKMPSLISKLRVLEIVNFVRSRNANSKIFPMGFSLAETFPKLTVVKIIVTHFPDSAEISIFDEFLNYFNFGEDKEEPLSLGVKKVILDSECVWPESFATIPALLNKKIQTLFPNACIKIDEQSS